jgi:hypothetical protein
VAGQKKNVPGSTGLILSGSDTYVSANRFKKLDLGFMLMVDDPNFGSAANTAIDENRFEDVALDIMTGAGPSMMALSAETLKAAPRFGPR